MKVAIDQIQVDEELRIRKDTGDLGPLQNSIEKVGLINPILVDENNNLVAGYRRLSACKNLNWNEIEATMVVFNGDQVKMLDAEIEENFFRKDLTPEEILFSERLRLELLEKLREKGIFERFWLWLKGLFQAKPEPVSDSVPESVQKPASEPVLEPASESVSESEPVSEPEPVLEPEPVAESIPAPAGKKIFSVEPTEPGNSDKF